MSDVSGSLYPWFNDGGAKVVLERSSTSTENPIIDRPDFGKAGSGTQPLWLATEPEPAVNRADSVLTRPDGHKGLPKKAGRNSL